MHGEHVDLVGAHQPVDNAIGSKCDFSYRRRFEFRNGSIRFREWNQPLGGGNQPSDDDRRVVGRVLADEGVNGRQVGTGLFGPEENPHDMNCFLISSWDTSWRPSD